MLDPIIKQASEDQNSIRQYRLGTLCVLATLVFLLFATWQMRACEDNENERLERQLNKCQRLVDDLVAKPNGTIE